MLERILWSSLATPVKVVDAWRAISLTSNGCCLLRPRRSRSLMVGSVAIAIVVTHDANCSIDTGLAGVPSAPVMVRESPATDMKAPRSFSPCLAQYSALVTPERGIACANALPVRNAPDDVDTALSGDHRALGRLVAAPGSNTAISPLAARAAAVASYRSRFTETATTGPSQVAIADAASAVFPDPVGPIRATDPRLPWRRAARPLRGCRLRSSVARS